VGAELIKVDREAGLPEDSALALRHEYESYYNDITKWRKQAATITDPDNVAHQKLAGVVRRGLKAVRCDVDRTRKALKADSLKRGKAIDGYANVLTYLCEPIEAQLFEIEQYAERKEQARIAALAQERAARLVAVGCDPTIYNLGAMDDSTFAAVLAGAVRARDERLEAARREEAARIAEVERKAAEDARIRAENAQLKAEADAREAQMAKERAESEAKAKREKAIADAKLKSEREAREKLEAEKREKERAAAAKIAADNAAAENALRAPDNDKLIAFADALAALRCPGVKSKVATDIAYRASTQIDALAQWIKGEAGKL
jgi:colicin import membrane protein